MVTIAKAIDRAESMRLRGHLAATGDRMHCSSIGAFTVKDTSLKARRGHMVTPDWLLAAIAEASDEEDLEEGDCLRLLVETTANGAKDAENQIASAESWTSICRNLGLLNRKEPDAQNSSDDEPPTLEHSISAQLEMGLKKSLEAAVSGALYHSQAPAETEAARLEALEDYKQVKDAIVDCLGDLNDDACGPFVLELLLQLVVRDWPGHEGNEMVPGGAAALVCSLLWSYRGWDSPIGRRLIRRLCVVFNHYAADGILTRTAFIQLCNDAGWVTKRDLSAKNARWWKTFSSVCGEETEVVPSSGNL